MAGASFTREWRKTDRREVWEEVEAAARYSQADRARILEALCAMAAELVRQHADPARTMAYQEPLSDDSIRLFGRLREAYGRHG